MRRKSGRLFFFHGAVHGLSDELARHARYAAALLPGCAPCESAFGEVSRGSAGNVGRTTRWLAADCTAGGSLCVLVSSGVLVFPPAAAAPPGSKRARDEGALGFDQASATLVPLGFIPDMSSAAADAADDGDDGDMAD